MTGHRILLCCLCLSFNLMLGAQEFLLLEKDHSAKRIRISKGSAITYKCFNNDTIYTEIISGLCDTAFFSGNDIIPFRNIQKIARTNRPGLPRIVRKVAIRVGIAFPILDFVNRSISKVNPKLSSSAIWVSAAGLGLWGLAKIADPKWYRVNGVWKLRYLDARPAG